MKTYYIYCEGAGGDMAGCDYTIGCNMSIYTINANDMEEAYRKVVVEEFDSKDEWELMHNLDTYDKVTIIECAQTKSLDLKMLRLAAETKIKATLKAQKEVDEKAEFIRLSAKYGD